MTLLRKIFSLFYEARRWAIRLVFISIPLLIAKNQLELFRRIRLMSIPMIPFSIGLLVLGLWRWSPNIVNASGMLLDIAGFFRLLVKEEWDKTVQSYDDQTLHPYGPPSYVMREFFSDHDPEVVSEDQREEHKQMSFYFYENRGILIVIIGLAIQLASTTM